MKFLAIPQSILMSFADYFDLIDQLETYISRRY